MNWLQRQVQRWLGLRQRRDTAFNAASLGRLTSSWTTDPGAVNRWIRWEGRTLRARSRQLVRTDSYARKFALSVVNNVAGPHPFVLHGQVRRPRGEVDARVNRRLEDAWNDWSRAAECDVAGRLSLSQMWRALLHHWACDGEILVRLYPGEGRYGLRLQLLDVDRLDQERNEKLAGGRQIRCGVEMDAFGRPIAYYILRNLPGEWGLWGTSGNRDAERVTADQIIHAFVSEWPEQARGIPPMHAAMVRLWHLGSFEEAAVINARVGASKVAVLYTPDGSSEALATGKDSAGNLLEDASPGQYWTLPEGMRLEGWDPTFPDASVEPFVRGVLRGAAAAVGVAYHGMANDPSNVNYSTARVALLEERDLWMTLQQWFVEQVVEKVFDAWLLYGGLAGALPIEWYAEPRLRRVRFQGRTWSWVDPLKERQAQVAALQAKLTSRTRLAREQGEDIEEILLEIKAENEMAEQMGVKLDPQPAAPASPAGPTNEDDDDGSTNAAE